MQPDIALFSGGNIIEWAPKFAAAGTTVIDNSSAWRMDPTKKLIVPEINASSLTKDDKIIANPNCSTIQMVLVLANTISNVLWFLPPIYHRNRVKAVEQLKMNMQERRNAYKYPFIEMQFHNVMF
jgi:aspartate-semialdehyde dehydrogenase